MNSADCFAQSKGPRFAPCPPERQRVEVTSTHAPDRMMHITACRQNALAFAGKLQAILKPYCPLGQIIWISPCNMPGASHIAAMPCEHASLAGSVQMWVLVCKHHFLHLPRLSSLDVDQAVCMAAAAVVAAAAGTGTQGIILHT